MSGTIVSAFLHWAVNIYVKDIEGGSRLVATRELPGFYCELR